MNANYLILLIVAVLIDRKECSKKIEDGYSEIPKAKRLEDTKLIKEYVENANTRSYEHGDHTHSDPRAADQRSSQDYYIDQNEQDSDSYGAAAKFHTPSNPPEAVLQPIRRVEDTQVICHKSYMTVTFRFSAPFNGYVYPHEQFMNCIIFSGQNTYETTLTLHHGPCGKQQIGNANNPEFSAIIEHRLMIQWERDFICEDDSSIIVRCDRPDDFNKTISWNFRTLSLASTIERSTHPGPKMWMEIQRGEGPNAPPLDDKPVFIGDVLTVVFTLSDNVFWFGSNILSCAAVDGGDGQTAYEANQYNAVKTYTGKMTVIENECSTKPKIFSHFHKERITKDGNLETLHYAHFKAFRFPTSQKVVIQCDVQVCFKKCDSLPPCSIGFQPRSAKIRQRRSLPRNDSEFEEGSELDTVLFFKTIEVFSAEDGALREIPVRAVLTESKELVQNIQDCYTSRTFFGWILSFSLLAVFLLISLAWSHYKPKQSKIFETPTK